MNNTFWLLSLFSLLCFTATSQEPVEFLHLQGENGVSMAVQVENKHLNNVSKSVLMAENWVKTHVLEHYPATNITTIIVGHTVLCNKNQEQQQQNMGSFILPSLKNIHYTLTRWGLQNHIKPSVYFSPNCLNSQNNYIKPLLTFLQETNSPYVVENNPSPLISSFLDSMKKLGFPHLKMAIVTNNTPRKEKPFTRKLSFIDFISNKIDPFIAPSSNSHFSPPEPAFTANSPLPPLIGTISPSFTPPFAPHLAPMASPPQYGPHLPPCESSIGGGAPVGAPPVVHHHGLWCVAKPSVPSETLQEALDYACGDGGADCEAITPDGSCYMPDSLVAHASYAFNSYWQKTKRNGGTCGFGGTAMLVNSDPSYRRCRFVLT